MDYRWIVLFCLGILGCKKKVDQSIMITNAFQLKPYVLDAAMYPPDENDKYPCTNPLNYAPYPEDIAYQKTKEIRVNVHFMCSEDRKHGFVEGGESYMWLLMKNAMERLVENPKMNLPEDNDTPALQPNYVYKRVPFDPNDPDDTGYYYHYDDELYAFVHRGKNKNNYSRDVIKKYDRGVDSILQIWVLPHHPDSVISKTYKVTGTGIALGTSLKIAGQVEDQKTPWAYSSLLNHEIGHVLGLRHSWTGHDGCEDTPKHPNCWDTNSPKCNGAEVVSNNMMDYNNSQMSISPCQLGIMHRNMSKLGSKQRKLIEPYWCTLDISKEVIIEDEMHWKGARDLCYDIRILAGAELHIHCRLSMPPNGQIIVEPGGKLVLHDAAHLHNDCNEEWKGIRLLSNEKNIGTIEAIGNVQIENTRETQARP